MSKFTDFELIGALMQYEGNITQTARALGVSRKAVRERKKKLPEGVIASDVETFRSTRADTSAKMQQILLQYVTPDKLKKASLQQIGTLFGIMYDKERLEQNLATEYIAHANYHRLDPEQLKMVKDLAKELTEKKLKEIEYLKDTA